MLGLGLSIGAAQTLPLARYKIGGKAPAAVADFSAGVYGISGAPVGFDALFSFTRLSAAWKRNALGHWAKVLAGEPRTGHHIWQGGALVPAGVAVCSEVRTNLLLNNADLATQSVTVTAVEHTLSFTGTGTVTLSGAATDGPLVGTGTGSANRVILSFTPSAGSLTLTVSGDVQSAQLEVGPYATDYISTEGAQVSTAAESLQIDPSILSSAFGGAMPEELTIFIRGAMTRTKEPEDYANSRLMLWEVDYNNYLDMTVSTYGTHTGKPYFRTRKDGALSVKSGAQDAYSLSVEIPFALAFTLTATETEGFYNGISTGKVAYGGMANLLSVPLKLFPKGIGTLEEFRIWTEALPSAAMLEATS